jgi:hypothetical protein
MPNASLRKAAAIYVSTLPLPAIESIKKRFSVKEKKKVRGRLTMKKIMRNN